MEENIPDNNIYDNKKLLIGNDEEKVVPAIVY